jgi:hypothetical protein
MPRESEPESSLILSEEFDGPAGSPVDSDTWQPEIGGHGWGNEELQYYTGATENASLDGAGNLAIVVRCSGPQYTSARLISKDRVAFKYGLVRARIRIPEGGGSGPPFGCWARTSMRSGGRGAVRSMSWRASVRILRWCTELSMDPGLRLWRHHGVA